MCIRDSSIFNNKDEEEPRAIDSVASLGLKPVTGLVVLSPEMTITASAYPISTKGIDKVRRLISSKGTAIDKLLDPMTIGSLKISNLPDIFKSFLNHKAGLGDHGLNANDFITWLNGPASKLTASKLTNVIEHINQNKAGFDSVWVVANALIMLKYELKKQLDAHAGEHVAADIRGEPGHEGFVSDTPHGKIKLVNRPVFMKKV
jgi:hypothetical protein